MIAVSIPVTVTGSRVTESVSVMAGHRPFGETSIVASVTGSLKRWRPALSGRSLDHRHRHDRRRYTASLLLVERLFRIAKPKLLTLPWFAWLWTQFIFLRSKMLRLFRWV